MTGYAEGLSTLEGIKEFVATCYIDSDAPLSCWPNEFIAAFKALYGWTSAKGGAHSKLCIAGHLLRVGLVQSSVPLNFC